MAHQRIHNIIESPGPRKDENVIKCPKCNSEDYIGVTVKNKTMMECLGCDYKVAAPKPTHWSDGII